MNSDDIYTDTPGQAFDMPKGISGPAQVDNRRAGYAANKPITPQMLEDGIRRFYSHLRRYTSLPQAPELFYKIGTLDQVDQSNLEYLIAPDLAAGLPLMGALQERAAHFLKYRASLFGLNRDQLDKDLFLKHTLHSQMGTHCIFGFRYQGNEELEKSIVVHFDRIEHMVMITSIYQPDMYWASQDTLDQAKTTRTIEDIERGKYRIVKGKPHKLTRARWLPCRIMVDRQWDPEWAAKRYRLRLQVKYVTPETDYVFILDGQGNITRCYNVEARASFRLAKVYRNCWALGEIERANKPKALKRVVLRDVTSRNELLGRYVAVKDNIQAEKWLEWDELLQWEQLNLNSSLPDRVMAYYHIDLIQRYFRDLGLQVLDDYQGLNPVQVVLDREIDTKYQPNGQRIYFKQVVPHRNPRCTDARSARVIYHEFVHAVIDALARLRRQSEADQNNPRYDHILQAHAMDEGFADYFACSLASRQGGDEPIIGPMQVIDGGLTINSKSRRDLDEKAKEGNQQGLGTVRNKSEMLSETEVVYEWGKVWGRYLWRLRLALDVEVADTIIAHSLFFLTRWSTFGLGVMALVLADNLLFRGVHREAILNEGKEASDWKILNNHGHMPV